MYEQRYKCMNKGIVLGPTNFHVFIGSEFFRKGKNKKCKILFWYQIVKIELFS